MDYLICVGWRTRFLDISIIHIEIGDECMERTFLMVKPDGVQRNLVGEIVARFEKKGFQLVGGKLMSISRDLAQEHYGEHKERPFFGELVDFITSGPVFAMVWEGEKIILNVNPQKLIVRTSTTNTQIHFT